MEYNVQHLLADLQAAYDTVWRKETWIEKHKLGSPPQKKLVQLCRILSTDIYAKFQVGKHLCSEFKVNKGVRQGGAIAPQLFNVLLETAIR